MTPQSDTANLVVLDHPLIVHKLTLLRDRTTPTVQFRALLKELSLLMGYELTRDLPLADRPIETPIGPMTGRVVAGRKLAIVSILRAGLGMAEGLHALIPSAREGHIGLYRDEQSKRPVEYYAKIPNPADGRFILVDPMLATGHSAAAAVDVLNRHGVGDAQITFLALVAAPEGIAVFRAAHPEITVYTAAVDERLNAEAYIVPGLGDAGDRLFGTK